MVYLFVECVDVLGLVGVLVVGVDWCDWWLIFIGWYGFGD